MKKLQYNCYGHGNSGNDYANNTFTKSNQLVRICYRDKTHQKLFAFWCVLGKTHQKYLRFLVCFQAFFSFFFVTVTIFSQNTPKTPKKIGKSGGKKYFIEKKIFTENPKIKIYKNVGFFLVILVCFEKKS